MHTRRMEERKVTTMSAPRCEIIIQLPQWHEINLVVRYIRWKRPGKSFPYIRSRLSISQWKLQCAECIAPNRRASRSLPASDWMHSRDADSVRGVFCQWANKQATPFAQCARLMNFHSNGFRVLSQHAACARGVSTTSCTAILSQPLLQQLQQQICGILEVIYL